MLFFRLLCSDELDEASDENCDQSTENCDQSTESGESTENCETITKNDESAESGESTENCGESIEETTNSQTAQKDTNSSSQTTEGAREDRVTTSLCSDQDVVEQSSSAAPIPTIHDPKSKLHQNITTQAGTDKASATTIESKSLMDLLTSEPSNQPVVDIKVRLLIMT